MIGLFVILVISWGLLSYFEKENIKVLGFEPSIKFLSHFLIGFTIITIIVLLNIYMETIVKQVEWQKNEINYPYLLNAIVYHLKSALTEDLVFRGAILYILIKRIGANWAILISAIMFGIYHWFSFGILNERFILLAYVFIITGFTGYVWAYTFHKTKSIFMGLGFHVGANLIMSCFFESQPYGEMIFSLKSSVELDEMPNFIFSFFRGLFPSILMLLLVRFVIIKEKSNLKLKV